MAWTSLGAIRSGWQNDISTLVRGYYDNVNPTARTVDMTVDVYMSTTNGRSLTANVSGNGYIAGDGPTDTRDFTAGSNADSGFTYYTRSISYNANGEAVVTWGGWLRTNNVISFDQSIYTPSNLPSIPPLALTSLTVTRVSDGQQNLSWSIPAGVTNTEVVIQRRTNDGAWTQVGRPSGNVSSWSDTTTVANRKYEYRVAGVRSGRQAAWTGTVTVYTTPAPPGVVSAEKIGSNIQVTATDLPPYATAYDVQESTNGGGSWSTLQSGVTSWPWTHVSPSNAVTHTYRVRSTRGALVSAYSDPSNTVALLAPPNPPTGLVPNGVAVAAGTVRFQWVHNPVDTTAQTAYELRHRLVGGPSWTTLSGTTAAYRDVSLTASATDREWQVRTKGSHASWSDWSAVALVSVITVPGVAVTQPGDTWGEPVLPVQWSWSQAEGRPQSAWRVRLFDVALNLLEEREGSGDVSSVTLNYRVATGQTYIVEVQAATGSVWSAWASQQFDTLFVPPAVPDVSGGWTEPDGSVTLTVEEGVEDPAPPATVSVTVERAVDGGDTWELVLVTVPGVTFSDGESLSNGETLYRVTAIAASGAASTVIYPVIADSGAVWLSGGIGFSRTARLPLNPTVRLRASRVRSVEHYEGRTRGVGYAGEQTSLTVEVGGALIDRDITTAEVDGLIDLVQDDQPLHMIRDPDGRRIVGVISDVNIPRKQAISRTDGTAGMWEFSFSLEETDR